MLLCVVALIALSGILYQLLIGTLSSYLIGDSVTQFSLTIGLFLTGMGIGSFLSRFVKDNVLKTFFYVEIILTILGGSSVILLNLSYTYLFAFEPSFYGVYILLTLGIGALVGLEIPLILKIYQALGTSRDEDVSNIFTFDSIGALFASILFPLVLVPFIGVYRTAIVVAFLSLLATFLYLHTVWKHISRRFAFISTALGVCAGVYLLCLLFASEALDSLFLRHYYREPIIYHEQSAYQKIVLTKRGEDIRLFLNGNLQFLSLDEARYHEAIVDWPLHFFKGKEPLRVLVLGGGDGLVVRNILKHQNVEHVVLVELDARMINISKTQQDMVRLNHASLNDERVEVVIGDAFSYVQKADIASFDLIIADFPDPRDVATSKLYSQEFYTALSSLLRKDGVFVTQAGNAFFSKESFWSINATLGSVFAHTRPYHRYIPSFGDWGFILAAQSDLIGNPSLCPDTSCDSFDSDYRVSDEDHIEVNTLAKPVIIQYFDKGYKRFNL